MPTFFTDFSEYATGALPSDWTLRWAGSGLTVETVTGADGGKALSQATISDAARGGSWNDVDALSADVEVVSRVKHVGASGVIHTIGLFVRGANATATRDLYVAGFDLTSSFFRISKFVAGVQTTLGSVSLAPTSDTWYWIRLRANGSSIKAKCWPDGSAEPGAWDIEVTDASITNAGWQGIFNSRTSSGTARYYDNLGVGTDGDTAPMSAAAPAGMPPQMMAFD